MDKVVVCFAWSESIGSIRFLSISLWHLPTEFKCFSFHVLYSFNIIPSPHKPNQLVRKSLWSLSPLRIKLILNHEIPSIRQQPMVTDCQDHRSPAVLRHDTSKKARIRIYLSNNMIYTSDSHGRYPLIFFLPSLPPEDVQRPSRELYVAGMTMTLMHAHHHHPFYKNTTRNL